MTSVAVKPPLVLWQYCGTVVLWYCGTIDVKPPCCTVAVLWWGIINTEIVVILMIENWMKMPIIMILGDYEIEIVVILVAVVVVKIWPLRLWLVQPLLWGTINRQIEITDSRNKMVSLRSILVITMMQHEDQRTCCLWPYLILRCSRCWAWGKCSLQLHIFAVCLVCLMEKVKKSGNDYGGKDEVWEWWNVLSRM